MSELTEPIRHQYNVARLEQHVMFSLLLSQIAFRVQDEK